MPPEKVNVKKLLNLSKEISLFDATLSWAYLTKLPICRALIFATKSTITEMVMNDQAKEIIRPLDESQRRAVASTIGLLTDDNQHFLLIEGPPGTGKTTALVAIVRAVQSLETKFVRLSSALHQTQPST